MADPRFARTRQCKACPWRKSTAPAVDIPGGYNKRRHTNLARCDGSAGSAAMACHESPVGSEQACVGWLAWAVGPGNSIPLRLAAMRGDWNPNALVLDGDQHESLDAMCRTAGRRKGAR